MQPMKAAAAMGIAGLASYDVLIATGILLGLTLIILSYTNVIGRLEGLFPRTVLLGMRLALAISLVASVLDYSDFELLPMFILLVGLIAMQFSPLKTFNCPVTLLIGWWWLGESGLWPEMVV